MKKILNWFKSHRPTKRRLIQVYAALLFNANIKGYITGEIYMGKLKNACTPGLNCYSCPGASGACPLGALQNSLASSGKTAPYYVFGIIMLYGLMFGRWICGFLCPFGLIQELFHKIPTPKIKKGRITRVLSFFKYVVLAFFVILLPLAYAFRNFPLPGFCKYICPAGTLEGAMGLLSNRVNESYLRMLGPLFTWKFLLMVSILVACVFIFRFFCRFLCPLGALYGLFNRISLVGVKLDRGACTDCGLCVGKCKMDIKHVGDAECIQCGECMGVCPTKAISWKGGKIFLAPNAIDGESEISASDQADMKKTKRRHTAVKATVAILMAALLGAALYYYNFVDGKEDDLLLPPDTTESVTEAMTEPDIDPSTESTPSDIETDPDQPEDTSTETESVADTTDAPETQSPQPKPPVGTAVGNTCPSIVLDLVGRNCRFSVADNVAAGKVTVLNFWFTTCGPCLHELPYFYQVAKDYADSVSVVAVHIEQRNVDVTGFIQNASGHPEWNDGTMLIGWDTAASCQKLFRIQACPVTVVINADGVITDYFVGSLMQEELIAAVEKALGNQ